MTIIVTSVVNPSSRRQDRWCQIPMDLQVADTLPNHCLIDGKVLAVKSHRIGDMTQIWHARVDVPAKGLVMLLDWQPWQFPLPAFEPSEWLSDDLEQAELKVNIRDGGKWTWLQLRIAEAALVGDSGMGRTYEWWRSAAGWHSMFRATCWSGQDSVDLEGVVIWSDQSTSDWTRLDALVSLEAGWWDHTRTPVTAGEPLGLYHEKRLGFHHYDPHRVRLWSGHWPHGVGLPMRGVMMPDRDAPGRIIVTRADREARAYAREREDLLQAASEAPLDAATVWPRGRWFALGEAHVADLPTNAAEFDALMDRPGTPWDQKPGANFLDHGRGGNQPVFGAVAGSAIAEGDAWAVREIRFAADDYWARACHHRVAGGRVSHASHPGVQTWRGNIFHGGADLLGKNSSYSPSYNLGGRDVSMDDQHRGSNPLCAAAAAGDWLSLECLRDLLAVDEMRAMKVRASGTLWFLDYDAPRTSGRLLQTWAKAVLLFTGADRDRAIALAQHELLTMAARRDHFGGGGPIRPIEIMAAQPRMLAMYESVAWWQHALAVLGTWEMAAALDRLGLLTMAAEFREFSISMGRQIIEYGTVWDSVKARWSLIYAGRWLPGGQALPAEYYRVPRAASYEDGNGADADLIYCGPGWWNWASAAVKAAATGGPDDAIRARAGAILAAYSSIGRGDRQQREWWAV